MTVEIVSYEQLSGIVDDLLRFIDFDKDLPLNIFLGDQYDFWFFERPLISFVDVFRGVVSESLSNFSSQVFVKFSGVEVLSDSCFSINGDDVERGVSLINQGFKDFFGGRVGYPVVFFNGSYDWIGFESSREEFGVIAVRMASRQEGFFKYLESNFISCDEISDLCFDASAEGVAARAFACSYCK